MSQKDTSPQGEQLPEDTVPLPPNELLSDFVERRIQQAMAEGLFDNLTGKGKPLPGLDEPYDEAWWVKQLGRREKFCTLEMELRIKIEILREKASQEKDPIKLRSLLEELNRLIVRLNKLGPTVVTSAYAVVDVEETLRRLLSI